MSAFPITPADEDGVVDTDDLMRMTDRLVTAGVDSIGLLGSTGIYAYLTRTERRRAIRCVAGLVRGRTPLIVSISAIRTDDAQALARDAEAEGADGLLLAPMSYTPLAPEEIYQHYAAVAGATGLPLCVYNNPVTTHFTFSRELLERLTELPAIAAVKMPPPSGVTVADELKNLRKGALGECAIGYSGDWCAAEALLAGCDAWFSVCGGFLPKEAHSMVHAARQGDYAGVRRHDERFQPLWALFHAFGGLRVAYAAAAQLGLTEAQPPRPILPLSGKDRHRVAEALRACSCEEIF